MCGAVGEAACGWVVWHWVGREFARALRHLAADYAGAGGGISGGCAAGGWRGLEEVEAGDAAVVPAHGSDDERAHAFAVTIAAQVGGEVVEYSTIDFGRGRKAGARTLLLDRNGRPQGERGIALVRHLRRMGLPPGVQMFANTLRDLSDDAAHLGRDQVVYVASSDPFEVIRVAEV